MDKYVSNNNIGTTNIFPNKFNDWYRMKHYLDIKKRIIEYWYD